MRVWFIIVHFCFHLLLQLANNCYGKLFSNVITEASIINGFWLTQSWFIFCVRFIHIPYCPCSHYISGQCPSYLYILTFSLLCMAYFSHCLQWWTAWCHHCFETKSFSYTSTSLSQSNFFNIAWCDYRFIFSGMIIASISVI